MQLYFFIRNYSAKLENIFDTTKRKKIFFIINKLSLPLSLSNSKPKTQNS